MAWVISSFEAAKTSKAVACSTIKTINNGLGVKTKRATKMYVCET